MISAVVYAAIRSLAVAILVKTLLAMLRVTSPAVRHAAWTTVLVSMLLMPVLPAALWFVEVPITIPARLASQDEQRIPVTVSHVSLSSSVPAPARVSTGRDVPVVVETVGTSARSRTAGPGRFPAIVGLIYVSGVIALVMRLLVGWSAARKIYRSSAPIRSLAAYESAHVAAPVTIGLWSPRIILPLEWKEWSSGTLESVIVHEQAHIRRLDSSTALLAQLNTCVFWFHPVAWWLRRELVVTAELACDAASVRTTGRPREYAEALLVMADAVRRRGARVLQGVAVDGSALEERIDRILQGDVEASTSATRKTAIAIGCVAAVLIAVACRPRIAPVPLQEDVEFSKQLAAQKANREADAALRAMTPRQVGELEAAVIANPEDLEARRKLLTFYGPDISGKRRPNEDEVIAARRRHILWLIEHQPEHELAGQLISRIYPTPRDWQADPAGYEQGKTLWLAYAARPAVHARALANAAGFFESADKPLAERMLLQGQSIVAARPTVDSTIREYWSSRLADLYYQIIVGSNAATLGGAIRSFSLDDAHGPFANGIRQKLNASRDATLLAETAAALLRSPQDHGSAYPANLHVDFSTFDLGKQYLERAASLDAQSPHVRRAQAMLRSFEYDRRFRALVGGGVPSASQAERVARLPDSDRFVFMPALAEHAYIRAEHLAQKDEAAARESYQAGRRYAEETLRLAPGFTDHAGYAGAVFRARIALATLALREGNRRESLKRTREAVGAGAGSHYQPGLLWNRLATTLLESGEREAVIALLEHLARIDDVAAESYRQAASAIRAGRMPAFYQAGVTAP
jgi:beta-lactamase regulating signal transducer with metallopeptidase domain